ncbi:uncharacterized protein AB675_1680 [Cyphellophora attinorum]|uniref:RING-type domain-containing protein n=1 Tax=Cyphellophora attinorum TaxID=1664694 RepID=A0A0N0NIQ7_9EURO|nr:uncharacterized protein AB675_1680 [Phialophora attinorum]KPI36101.1 hypothetical protein AB675_1680 [Phialophora attinorum]
MDAEWLYLLLALAALLAAIFSRWYFSSHRPLRDQLRSLRVFGRSEDQVQIANLERERDAQYGRVRKLERELDQERGRTQTLEHLLDGERGRKRALVLILLGERFANRAQMRQANEDRAQLQHLTENGRDEDQEKIRILRKKVKNVTEMWISAKLSRDGLRSDLDGLVESGAIRREGDTYTADTSAMFLPKHHEIYPAHAVPLNRYNDDQCAICLDDIIAEDSSHVPLPCGHQFHKTHIQQWFGASFTCPTCHTEFRWLMAMKPPMPSALGRVEVSEGGAVVT